MILWADVNFVQFKMSKNLVNIDAIHHFEI